MKNLFLNYYNNFECISTKCKHNCCIGWKINIDKKSLREYKRAKGDFGVKLKNGINFNEKSFNLTQNKRCVFLNDKNLCEIICNLGKNSLCQICTDHPRFRNFFVGFSETGLGFCCEEACRIILSQTKKICIETGEKPIKISKKDRFVLESREKVLSILQNREKTFSERIIELINSFEPIIYNSENDWQCWKNLLKSIEILDDEWLSKLEKLNSKSISDINLYKILDANASTLEQFAVNTVYRHYVNFDNQMEQNIKLSFVLFALYLVIYLTAESNDVEKFCFNTLVENVRSFSSEIEYSENNLTAILEKIEGDIFISKHN